MAPDPAPGHGKRLFGPPLFLACGYPAVMLTDTAHARYPFYHYARETQDSGARIINFPLLARIVFRISQLLETMASKNEKLGFQVTAMPECR